MLVQTDEGTLSVLAEGPVDGERIVLMHGIPANAQLFREVLPLLAEAGYRALAPDMPGYGRTRLADSADYSLSAVADLYARWLERDGLAPVWLVGHDLGGAVAQMIAVRYPHLISHLTLGNCPIGDSFPVFAIKIVILAAKLGIFKPLSRLGLIPNPETTRELRRGFAQPSRLTQEMVKSIFWDTKVSDPQGRDEFVKHLKHLRNDETVAVVPHLAHINVPSLVLWSALDRFQPAETIAMQLRAALPAHTDFEVIGDAGHFMPIEAPAAYAQALLKWKQGLPA